MSDCKVECKGGSCNYRDEGGCGFLIVIVVAIAMWTSCNREERIEKKVDQIQLSAKFTAERDSLRAELASLKAVPATEPKVGDTCMFRNELNQEWLGPCRVCLIDRTVVFGFESVEHLGYVRFWRYCRKCTAAEITDNEAVK